MWSTHIKKRVYSWLSDIQALTHYGTCELCLSPAAAAGFLCASCFETLVRSEFACSQCAEPLMMPGRCGSCQSSPPDFDYGYSSYLYQPPLSLWLKAAKDKGQLVWLNRLAWLQQQRVPQTLTDIDALIVIPSGPRRLLYRGYNPAEILARKMARHFNIPLINNALYKSDSQDQRRLSATERRNNQRNALHATKTVFNGEHLLIIDDVLTTGATANAAARVLKQQGAGIVGVWSLCKTPAKQNQS